MKVLRKQGQQQLGHDGVVLLFERFKADTLVRGVLVEEQNGLALLDNDIGVQRLADDAEGLFRDRKRLLCFRLFDGFRLRLGPDLNLRFGLRLRSDLRLSSGFGSGKLCCAGTGSERGSCTGEASTGWPGFCTGCCAA